ncbi:unnamed protein product [Cylindrotheca closterium]|uniref:Uncharacterized protein n=1 Tax=Cylindrotheca closterium TaxID=2856 RepID=A0AAD2CX46_9STRA|nr:unnamed protein product [Cylindrotheca closterium]CAJ1939973.1 unnamed protein product [Cylindrotheca closterium]
MHSQIKRQLPRGAEAGPESQKIILSLWDIAYGVPPAKEPNTPRVGVAVVLLHANPIRPVLLQSKHGSGRMNIRVALLWSSSRDKIKPLL